MRVVVFVNVVVRVGLVVLANETVPALPVREAPRFMLLAPVVLAPRWLGLMAVLCLVGEGEGETWCV